MSGLFDVDIKGFKQTLVGETPRILCEPISNALDTEANSVVVNFSWANGVAEYSVTDDDPEGFSSLRDAYTLFAPSTRKGDAEKRGRFGLGEKEFIAVCWPGEVEIASTTGAVTFAGDVRKESPRRKRDFGSSVTAKFRLSKADSEDFIARVHQIIPPAGVKLTVNWGKETLLISPRVERRLFHATLPTVYEDADGNVRATRRKTTVLIYEPQAGETPTIFELGIPVVEHDGRFHINVGQKVPLNRGRDNVPPSYLKLLREEVLNVTYDILSTDDVKKAWVTEALPNADTDAFRAVVTGIHGANAVIADASNPEATKLAVEQGRSVIHGPQFPREVWARIREETIFKPAGQVIQTGVPTSPDGKPPIPEDLWDLNMIALAEYTREAGQFLLGFRPMVRFQNLITIRKAGWWGNGEITFNLGVLGKRWPGEASQESIDALLIHEFAHHTASDHYSAEFYGACCRLGAALRCFKGKVR